MPSTISCDHNRRLAKLVRGDIDDDVIRLDPCMGRCADILIPEAADIGRRNSKVPVQSFGQNFAHAPTAPGGKVRAHISEELITAGIKARSKSCRVLLKLADIGHLLLLFWILPARQLRAA
ncbi:hypothetical protein [Azospirillum palustre]